MSDSSDDKSPEAEFLKPEASERSTREKPAKEPRVLEGTAEEVDAEEASSDGETEAGRSSQRGGSGAEGSALGMAGLAAAAGFGGAGVALLVAWVLGFGAPAVSDAALADLAERFDALENGSDETARASDTFAQSLAERLDAAEEKLAAVEGGAADGQITQLAEEQQRLKQALDDTRGTARAMQQSFEELSARVPQAGIEDRIAALGQLVQAFDARLAALGPQIETMETRVATLEAKKEDPDAAARAALGLALANLARASESGGTFATELETVAAFLPDEPALEKLSGPAEMGVQTRAALDARFPSVVEAIFDAERRADEQGIWSRFVANAKSLVTIRRTGEISGETTEAVVARMEERLKTGDLAGAVTEAAALQGPAAEAANPWLEAAQARLDADALVRDLSARVAGELAKARG